VPHLARALGFGFQRVGRRDLASAARQSPPRLFRAIKDEAIVNSMGFNNPGAEAFARTLAQWKQAEASGPIIRLGSTSANPKSPRSESRRRLRQLLPPPPSPRRFFRGQRQFSQHAQLAPAPGQIRAQRNPGRLPGNPKHRTPPHPTPRRPIFVKVAPDLSFEALDEILELAGPRQVAGIVATNTTITRPETSDPGCARLCAAPAV
jgi:dihydroorotate dehydrogenase